VLTLEDPPIPRPAYRIGKKQVRGSLQCRISTQLMTGWGQKLLLPQCKSNGRFTSVSGHKGRRSWMMRALRILDSPLCADSRYPSRLSG
jgi:hypothetical protein